MSPAWPALPYEVWQPTRDTLHSHTQVLGKLAVSLAPPEPQLQHAALRLTARGWETQPLPAPDGSGSFVVALDLRTYEALVEHSDGRDRKIPLTPDRAVGEVTRAVLAAVGELAGPVKINPTPQETAWKTPLDEDDEHASFDRAQVDAYFAAATRAAQVLAEARAPYRGRSTPVNAWWGAFDLSVGLFSGRPVPPPSDDFIMRNSGDAEQVAVGWWPGDTRYPRRVLRVRVSRARGALGRAAFPGRRTLGRNARRIHPRLGRRPRTARPARRRARVRPFRRAERLRSMWLGPAARRERRGGHGARALG
ncbi:MAG TPA: DUF5996 family protein [Gaiellaceae bacterium]|jgi:hypothetical protein|nr:DUF5996 family protein [Gaiellaceae bacterium]